MASRSRSALDRSPSASESCAIRSRLYRPPSRTSSVLRPNWSMARVKRSVIWASRSRASILRLLRTFSWSWRQVKKAPRRIAAPPNPWNRVTRASFSSRSRSCSSSTRSRGSVTPLAWRVASDNGGTRSLGSQNRQPTTTASRPRTTATWPRPPNFASALAPLSGDCIVHLNRARERRPIMAERPRPVTAAGGAQPLVRLSWRQRPHPAGAAPFWLAHEAGPRNLPLRAPVPRRFGRSRCLSWHPISVGCKHPGSEHQVLFAGSTVFDRLSRPI